MADMFKAFKLPIFIQTCSSEHLSEIRPEMANWRVQIPWFKLGNHEHVARLLLLCQVRMFIREQSKILPQPVSVIIDEGLQKPGNELSMPGWADLFAGGCATFRNSNQTSFLQLADFAAFVVARAQWIPNAVLSAYENSARDYERVMQADRLLKGLPLSPRWQGRIVKPKGP